MERHTDLSQVSRVARVARDTLISRALRVARFARVARDTFISRALRVAGFARAARVARFALLALVAFTLSGCGAGDDAAAGDNAAARRSGDVQLVDACELIAAAQLDPVLGAPFGEPDSYTSGFDDDSSTKYSSCAYSGQEHGILLKLTFPYSREFSSSEEWAQKVREDYARSVESMDDPELVARMGNPQTYALDGVGDVAAWIDLRESVDQVVLHAIHDGRQRTYIELYAPDLEVARQVAERLLPVLP